MFKRAIQETLLEIVSSFPVTVLSGPRQSGKTTLIKYLFPNHYYINLEFPDDLSLLKSDPRNIINTHLKSGLIIDEAQRFPELFSYIQGYVDQKSVPGQFILSGSQNFLLANQVSQSLSGRAAMVELLPLSYKEYGSHSESDAEMSLWNWLYSGTYPRPYQEHINIKYWYKAYIQTYLERDLRYLTQVHDISQFQRFLKLCAARHGQMINLTELARDADITRVTAKHWLSLLQTSYIVFLLRPYHKNFSKRLVKMPKLYFYDSAIVCQLLGIESPEHLSIHSSRGAIFEGYVITELLKQFYNKNTIPSIYFWRDHHGVEMDCLLESNQSLQAFEIKSSMTFRPDWLKGLKSFDELTQGSAQLKLVYAGDKKETVQNIEIIPWREI